MCTTVRTISHAEYLEYPKQWLKTASESCTAESKFYNWSDARLQTPQSIVQHGFNQIDYPCSLPLTFIVCMDEHVSRDTLQSNIETPTRIPVRIQQNSVLATNVHTPARNIAQQAYEYDAPFCEAVLSFGCCLNALILSLRH